MLDTKWQKYRMGKGYDMKGKHFLREISIGKLIRIFKYPCPRLWILRSISNMLTVGQALVVYVLCVINLCDALRNLNIVEIGAHITSD
jgi:hypothetical protein